MHRILALLAGVLAWAGPALAADLPAQTRPAAALRPAAVVDLHGTIDDYSRRSFTGRFDQAVAAGAKVIIIDIDTYGGMVTSALEISHFIKQHRDVHTIAYVDTKAYSAGSLIALSCDEIAMNPTAAIGDCAPIMYRPDGTVQTLGADERAKAASPILADFLDSAHRNGYDPTLVTAMVTAKRVVNWLENPTTHQRRFADAELATQLLASGQWQTVKEPDVPDPLDGPDTLLTLNTDLAMKVGLAKGAYTSVNSLATARGLDIRWTFSAGNWQSVIEFLNQSWVRTLLISIFMLALYISLHAPGHGMAEVVAVSALALAVGVPLLTGYAQWWEIGMILVGIILLAVELFIIPGFGVVGLSGIALIVAGLVLTFVAPEPGRSPLSIPSLPGTWGGIQRGLLAVIGAMVLSIIVFSWIRAYLPRLPVLNRLVLLTVVGQSESGRVGSLSHIEPSELLPAVGAHGIAVTDLKPGGSVQFEDAAGTVHMVSVVSDGFVARGTKVVVTAVDGPSIHVRNAGEAV